MYAIRSYYAKMAKDPDTVLAFLNELADASMAQGQRELAELREFAGAQELQSYDSAFYGEQLKKARYDIDEEEYRPYFEQNSVVEGLFEFLHRLFGVSIRPAEDVRNNFV